jgi:D-alanyl-D-alanine carboxypeptidase/D-alanyl-D-alanine-endopeptidase (penicillin-binding protein 4)
MKSAVYGLLLWCCAGILGASELSDKCDRLLDGVPRGGLAAVAVYDLGVNAWLYRHEADQPRALASTTKSLVAAAALTQFGPQFRFHTQVYAVGPLAARIQGLGVVGGGDPCLDGHFTDDQPEAIFLAWAEQLKRQGVTAIDGDVVIDGRLFSGPIRPATYPQDQDNLQRWYSAPASAFAWNDNCIEVRVVPTRVGERANVEVRPQSSRIAVINKARTVAGKGDKAIFVVRDLDSNRVTVTGNYAAATPWFPLAIHADPDLLAGEQLKASLQQSGIVVGGTVRLGPVDPRGGRLLIDHTSPLVPAVTLMNQHSQNFYGEQMLRLLGFERFQDGSLVSGSKATLLTLKRLVGDRVSQITLLDGSGLSYGNEGTAGVMVEVFAAMHRSPLREEFYNSLKERNVGKIQGRVKTGTLAVATCLVGYLDPPSGHRLAFAMLFNRGTSRDFGWAPKIREQLYRVFADL